jgi:hypothetical protein
MELTGDIRDILSGTASEEVALGGEHAAPEPEEGGAEAQLRSKASAVKMSEQYPRSQTAPEVAENALPKPRTMKYHVDVVSVHVHAVD